MDDLETGTRDKRGHWAPNAPIPGAAPIWAFPPQPLKVLRWLPGYLLPWNAVFAATALVYWFWLIPPLETMRVIAPGWIAWLYAVNAIGVGLFYGAFELRLYVQRAQGGRFKYNPKFPGDDRNPAFWFGSQTVDSVLHTFLSGVVIWTAIEAGILWAYANGHVPSLGWEAHPAILGAMFFLVPVLHEFHFYCIHRLIHVPFLYRHVHSVHHNSVNPSPWSSLAMHPVEHLLYFGGALWYLLIPAHPLIAVFALHRAGFGAIPGHVGFDRMEAGGGRGMDTHAYAHYLHHKYFEVNYGDGLVPLDTVFGTWHDGTAEGDRRMQARFKARREKLKARAAAKG